VRLQRSIGNAAAARLLASPPNRQPQKPCSQWPLSRQPQPSQRSGKDARALEGRVVLQGKSRQHEPVTVRTTQEIVPPWEDKDGFPGFGDELLAVISATRRSTEKGLVTVVWLEGGAFHALETDTRSLENVPDASPSGSVVRVLEPRRQVAGEDWSKRIGEAKAAPTLGEQTRAYIDLLVEVTGIERGNVHVCPTVHPSDKAPPDAKPGLLNFALWKRDANATTYPATLRAHRTEPLPEPVIVMGPESFERGSPEFVRGTVVHETRHARHLKRLIELISDWRASGSRRTFHQWLERHQSVTDEIRWVAQTAVEHPSEGGVSTATTEVGELFANLESLKIELHYLRPEDLGATISSPDGSGTSRPSTSWASLKARLMTVAKYYIDAELEAPKREFLNRLAAACSTLTPDRRTAFARLVAELPAALASNSRLADRRADWEPFVKELEAIASGASGSVRTPD
jgi:hypothetical protein